MNRTLKQRLEFVRTRSVAYPFHVPVPLNVNPRPTEVEVRPFCRVPFVEENACLWMFETHDDAILFKIFIVKRIAAEEPAK